MVKRIPLVNICKKACETSIYFFKKSNVLFLQF